jgi:hypothetical protein
VQRDIGLGEIRKRSSQPCANLPERDDDISWNTDGLWFLVWLAMNVGKLFFASALDDAFVSIVALFVAPYRCQDT